MTAIDDGTVDAVIARATGPGVIGTAIGVIGIEIETTTEIEIGICGIWIGTTGRIGICG